MSLDRYRLSSDSFLYRHLTLIVLLIYGMLSLVMTWPLLAELGTRIPGSGGDALVHLWTFDWVKDALSSGSSPFYTDRLFHPDGASLIFHNFAWLHIAAWLPLQALFGPATAYTIIFFIIFTLNGFATYLLARDVTGREGAAFIGGLVCAFWPYLLSQHNHPNLIFIAFIPMALLYLGRLFASQSKKDAVLAGLFIALIGYARWQLLVIGGLLISLYILYTLVVDKSSRSKEMIGLLLLVFIVAGLIMAPLLSPVLYAQVTRDDPEDLFVDEELEQTDLLAYFVPNRYHPLWGEAVLPLYKNFDVNQVFVPFIGYVTLLLAVWGTFSAWPKSRFWLLAALLVVILALGTRLIVNGEPYFTMPYMYVKELFFIKIVRRPDRFNAVLAIPVSILAAYGVSGLQRRIAGRQRTVLLVGGLSLLILLEYVVAYPTLSLDVPAWYRQLEDDRDDYAVLGVPMHPRSFFDKTYMLYQMTHNKPLVEGHISRPTADTFDFINSVPLLRSLHLLHPARPPEVADVTGQLDQLAGAHIQFLVLHKSLLLDEELLAWRKWLYLEPVHEDEDVVVYETTTAREALLPFAQVMTTADGGQPQIGILQLEVTPLANIGELQLDAIWGSDRTVADDYDICHGIVSENGVYESTHCQLLSSTWPTSSWREGEIVQERANFRVDGDLEPGVYTLSIYLAQSGSESAVGETMTIGNLRVDPVAAASASWEGGIALPSYRIDQLSGISEELKLTLNWLPEAPIEKSYKLFVHLLDASGQLVAQKDLIPGDGTLPTSAWRPGEVVEDVVTLQLDDLTPGQYMIMIGLYDEGTGERLPAFSLTDGPYTDAAVPLGSIIILAE